MTIEKDFRMRRCAFALLLLVAFSVLCVLQFSTTRADTSGSTGTPISCKQGGPGCADSTLNLFEWTHSPGITTLRRKITPGNTVVVAYDGICANMPIAISGGADTYTTLAYECDKNNQQGVGLAYVCRSAGGYNEVKGTFGQTNYGTGVVLELTGTNPSCPDGNAMAAGGSAGATEISVGPIMPAAPGDFFVAVAINPFSMPMASTWPGAIFLGTGQYGNARYLDLLSTNNSAQRATLTATNLSSWGAVLGAFKP